MDKPQRTLVAITLAIAWAVAACAGASDSNAPQGATADTEALSIPNNGTIALEGHTPRGFAGMGTGLFAGDNLNPNFPDGEGIQIWLSFAIPDGTAVPATATLHSNALSPTGDVFDALGDLQAAPVTFEAFGADLFDLEPTGELVTCERPTNTSLTCDVTDAAADAIANEASLVQLRLTFEELSDNDGERDLARFFLTDSNTNEPGIFFLDLS